jgi:hypothetical protein
MDLIKDIRSIEEVEAAPRSVLSTVHRTRRPLIVTVDGEPDVIVLPAESLSSKMTAMKAAVELAGLEA